MMMMIIIIIIIISIIITDRNKSHTILSDSQPPILSSEDILPCDGLNGDAFVPSAAADIPAADADAAMMHHIILFHRYCKSKNQQVLHCESSSMEKFWNSRYNCTWSRVTRHTSHVTRHTSHVTRHTSRVTRHTSHVTRHTSRVTRYTSHVTSRHQFRSAAGSSKQFFQLLSDS